MQKSCQLYTPAALRPGVKTLDRSWVGSSVQFRREKISCTSRNSVKFPLLTSRPDGVGKDDGGGKDDDNVKKEDMTLISTC
jgi:hypothetical protein